MSKLIVLLSAVHLVISAAGGQQEKVPGSLPITIKDFGVVELRKNDVAMVFYVTVTNVGQDLVHLFVNATKCCQKITPTDEDCESVQPLGGDMGQLFPQDSRNLTMVFVNLYPQNRVGSCDVAISNARGTTVRQAVPFNTTLVRGSGVRVPRLLERFYDPEDVASCDSPDHDPLNACRPYDCGMRYGGARGRYNRTSQRCEKVPRCLTSQPNQLVAYDVEVGVCRDLAASMADEDFEQFKEGKPSVHALRHEHAYPINVRCHNGRPDDKGHWCVCDEGWGSAPINHRLFNPDLQVYHMCTVWKGALEAEQARNITTRPRPQHRTMNIVIFSILGISLLMAAATALYLLFRMWKAKKRESGDLDKSEKASLMKQETDESDG